MYQESVAGVYRIYHLASGKTYVGSSTNVPDRWRVHRQGLKGGRHHSKHLQRAWEKYGEEAFEFVWLEKLPPEVELLLCREQHYMDLYEVCNPAKGYNSAKIAGSNAGNKLSPEARERIGASLRGRKQSEEHKAKKAAAMRGQKRSEETRRKISDAAKKRDPATRKMSEETKALLCERRAKPPIPPEVAAQTAAEKQASVERRRQRISDAMKGNSRSLGYRHTPDARKRIGEGVRAYRARIKQSGDHPEPEPDQP
jgi:group I intron endonuclease